MDLSKFSELQISGLWILINIFYDLFIFIKTVKIIDLKKAFSFFDKESKGVVTTEEIAPIFKNLGLFPTQQELDEMLHDIDIDGKTIYILLNLKQLELNLILIDLKVMAPFHLMNLYNSCTIWVI